VRKAGKRVRYVAEMVAGELRGGKQAVKAAKTMQQVLGDLQDTVVTREHCRRFGMAAFAAGENAFTYGRLHALEEARADRARATFWALEPEAHAVLDRGIG